ncbi:MAG: DMT family transporter [Gloeotrichia echinulata GP01]
MNENSLEQSATQNSTTETKTDKSRYLLGFSLLVGVSLILGSTFPAMKEALSDLSPRLLTTSRYVIAALVLSPFLTNLNKPLIRDGTIIGLLFFSTSIFECLALEDLSASRSGFTFSLSIVFVTLFEIVQGKFLSFVAIISATMAFSGVALMSWQSGESLISDVWILIAAILDSAYIVIIGRSVTVHSPFKLAAVSCWIPAILGLIWSAPKLRDEWTIIVDNIGILLYLGVVAIAIITVMETTGQQWVPSNEVAISRTIEPLSSAILSFLFLGETFNLYDYFGSGMLLFSIILLVLFQRKDARDSPNLENPINAEIIPFPDEEKEPNLQP